MCGRSQDFIERGHILADASQRPVYGQISFEILTDLGGHGPVHPLATPMLEPTVQLCESMFFHVEYQQVLSGKLLLLVVLCMKQTIAKQSHTFSLSY